MNFRDYTHLGTRSVCRVVWEGSSVMESPIPIYLTVDFFTVLNVDDPDCDLIVLD